MNITKVNTTAITCFFSALVAFVAIANVTSCVAKSNTQNSEPVTSSAFQQEVGKLKDGNDYTLLRFDGGDRVFIYKLADGNQVFVYKPFDDVASVVVVPSTNAQHKPL